MDRLDYSIRMESWAKIIAEANNSGMTKRKWCQLHDIKERQFHYWQKRIRDYIREHPEHVFSDLSALNLHEKADEQQVFYEVALSPESFVAPASGGSCENNASTPALPVEQLPTSEAMTPQNSHRLTLQYDRFQLLIDDGFSESTLASVIRVIKNA